MRNLAGGAAVSVAVLGLVTLAACGQTPEAAVPSPLFDAPSDGMTVQFLRNPISVADVVMADLDGRTMSTGDWHGKVTLVNYWATWCGPCREEIPYLIRLQEHYPDQLQVIGISTDQGDPEDVKAFARELGINYPIVMETTELRRQFPGVFALPTTFLVDREGRIVQTHVGLISPAVFEQEARYLSDLSANVTVELIDENQTTRLANAAQATEIPGLDLSELTPAQKEQALQRLNQDTCSCSCALTLAQCRINDGACDISLPLAKKVVEEIVGAD